MRLDKFLKVSRIIKRRTVANEACDGDRIEVNGIVKKASYQVKTGDIVSVFFGEKKITFEILTVKENVRKEEASEMYRIIEVTGY